MNNNNNTFFKFLLVFILGFSTYFLIQNFTSLTLFNNEKSIITVQGLAQENVSNQLAEFSAGIEVIAPTKEQAINNANQVVDQLLIDVKNFGIADEDIQTNQVSVYQENEDSVAPLANPEIKMIGEENITGKTGDWRANTSISITLRNEESALLKQESEKLLQILNQSQANYVYGPNFRLDEQYVSEGELINDAVADARNKAETIAAKNQQKIVKILEIVENDVSYRSFYSKELAANDISATSLEPGSSTLSKTVVVTFQVK